MFNIFEALFILALDDEEGDILESIRSIIEPILASTVLVELVFRSRIELIDNRISVINQALTEHPVLDKALFEILDTARARKPKYWINTLTYKNILEDIGQHLVEKEVLVRKKKRLRLVIPYGQSQDGNLSVKYCVKYRLREIVLAGSQPDLSEIVLLVLLQRADLLKLVFTHGERKAAKRRITKLIEYDEEGGGLNEILKELVSITCDSA